MGCGAKGYYDRQQELATKRRVIYPPFHDILKSIQHRYPSAVVVGGAVRDWLNGVPISDIDVACFCEPYALGLGLVEVARNEVGYGIKTRRFMGTYHGKQVDMFFRPDLDDTHNLMATFDIGLCKCAYDGADFILQHEYLHDVNNKHITIRNASFTQGYVERVKLKYPDFTVVP